jgi:hypothetical protein
MVDDHNSMDDDSGDEDVAEGILPTQASTIEANDNKLQTPTGTHRHPPTIIHGSHRQETTDTHEI